MKRLSHPACTLQCCLLAGLLGLAGAARVYGADAGKMPTADPKGYPTVDRVEFVLECMQRNGGRQEFLYKCACVIDQIAQKLTYDDFVESATAARYQNLPGDRGGEFRDPPETHKAAKQYLQIQSDAKKSCDVPR